MLQPNQVTLKMDVWVHSHSETGARLSWDWFNISGDKIPATVIDYLSSDERQEDLDEFNDLKTEQIYDVTVVMEYEPGDESIGLWDGWYIARLESATPPPSP